MGKFRRSWIKNVTIFKSSIRVMGTYLEIFNVNVHDSSDIEFGYTVAEHLTIVDELKIICLKNH